MGRRYLQKAADAPASVAKESERGPAEATGAGSGLVVYVNSELQRLRVLVEAARGRLAELEAGCWHRKLRGLGSFVLKSRTAAGHAGR